MIQAFDWSEPSAFGCTLAPCQVAEAKTTKRRAVGPGRRILWRSGIEGVNGAIAAQNPVPGGGECGRRQRPSCGAAGQPPRSEGAQVICRKMVIEWKSLQATAHQWRS